MLHRLAYPVLAVVSLPLAARWPTANDTIVINGEDPNPLAHKHRAMDTEYLMITVSQSKPYSLTRIVRVRREPDAYRAKANAEALACNGGCESGISHRSRNFRIFLIRNPLFQDDMEQHRNLRQEQHYTTH